MRDGRRSSALLMAKTEAFEQTPRERKKVEMSTAQRFQAGVAE